MEDHYMLGLAILDFVPTLAFLSGGYFLIRLAHITRGKVNGWIMGIGVGLIFLGGILKAIWKLLFTLEIADIQAFNDALFILQSPGFVMVLFATIMIVRSKPGKISPLTAMAAWKIPLLAVMTVSSLGTFILLSVLSFRRGVRTAALCFILTIVLTLAMSGMASGSEQTITNQWIEESMNSIGQISFAVGSILFYRVLKDQPEVACN